MNTDYEKHLFNKKNWGEENKPKTVFYFNFHCKKRNFFIKKKSLFWKNLLSNLLNQWITNNIKVEIK